MSGGKRPSSRGGVRHAIFVGELLASIHRAIGSRWITTTKIRRLADLDDELRVALARACGWLSTEIHHSQSVRVALARHAGRGGGRRGAYRLHKRIRRVGRKPVLLYAYWRVTREPAPAKPAR